jgi:hypothetical protein
VLTLYFYLVNLLNLFMNAELLKSISLRIHGGQSMAKLGTVPNNFGTVFYVRTSIEMRDGHGCQVYGSAGRAAEAFLAGSCEGRPERGSIHE